MSDELAEAVTEIMEERQDNLTTKADLKLLRSDVKQDISELRLELKQDVSNLRSDFKQDLYDFKSDIISWAIPTIIGMLSLNVATLGAIIALWFNK